MPVAITSFELKVLNWVFDGFDFGIVYVEIGSRHGDSLRHFAGWMPPKSTLVAVDLPGARWGKAGSEKSLAVTKDELAALGFDVSVILGDSHDPDVLQKVRTCILPNPIDVLFIDGDHTREGVEQDIRDYAPLVREGGIVMFHDCGMFGIPGEIEDEDRVQAEETMSGVAAAFRGYAKGRRSIVAQGRFGVGVVWK